MPVRRVRLKEKSPEFWEPETKTTSHICEHTGCRQDGEFKAPKNRGLNEYYRFCQEHVREYNKQWNFFDGMSDKEMEEHIYRTNTWDRPTWGFSDQQKMEDYLRQRVHEDFYTEQGSRRRPHNQKEHQENIFRFTNTPESEALAIMDLVPPITLKDIKARYKTLVKKHHPDMNGGSKESEEIFKKVSMAYTVLKVAYESFEKLDAV
ncbi:MAG: molecular chaperone DnaJ [Micavibrio sp.]|nr:molecular chaperone DnaJ [Micavibrio sp.]|tara:strand:- start:9250 stop:9867 length:618 start_codon:yes stop_codon:yes gene_type:complete